MSTSGDLPELASGAALTAKWLNALRARALRPVRAVAPLMVRETPAEIVVSLDARQEADFRIASGSNPYNAVEVQAQAGGGWAVLEGGRTPTVGVDPLWERNGNAAVTANTVVRAARATGSSEWIFDRSPCSGSAATPAPRPPTAPTTANPPATPTNPPAPNPPPTAPPPPPPPDPQPTDYPLPTDPYPDPGTPPPPLPDSPLPPATGYPEEPPQPPDPTDYPGRPVPTYETPPIVVFPRDSGEPNPGPLPPTGTVFVNGKRPAATPEDP